MFGVPNIWGREPPVLPTFVIGLREGLEASLIVGIIAAFLIQQGKRDALRPMWFGVALAIGLCVGAALVLEAVGSSLPFRQREIMEATLALLAVGGVTYMVVWMRRHSRELKRSLESHAEMALEAGTWALVGMAFFAVLREGLETAVFMLAAFQSSSNPAATGTGRHPGGRGRGRTRLRALPGRGADQPGRGSSASRGSSWSSWPQGCSRRPCTTSRRPGS